MGNGCDTVTVPVRIVGEPGNTIGGGGVKVGVGLGVSVGVGVLVGKGVGVWVGVAVGRGVSVGVAVGVAVASACAAWGAAMIAQRLTTVTNATMTSKVSPSAKSPRERCAVFVFASSTRVCGALYHERTASPPRTGNDSRSLVNHWGFQWESA